MTDVKQLVIKMVEENKSQMIEYLQEIIRFPSVLGEEKDAQIYYSNLLDKLDFDVDIWEPKPEDMIINPNFMASREDYIGSPNVVGTLKGLGGGRSILLNGHIDVVPAGNDWNNSPWSGNYEDGKIYGRGANDMKGGLIANLMAVKAIVDAGIQLKGDVIVASVIGEETGGAGTLSSINRGYKADAAIVPEPTDLRLCPVSMGVIWFRITVKGFAAHAATSYLGINAISKASMIIQKIDEYEAKMIEEKKHELYSHHPSPFSINIGIIKGGIFPTSVPDEVILEARMSFSPDDNISDVKKSLEEAVYDVAKNDGWLSEHLPEIEWYGFCLDSGSVDRNHDFVKTIKDNYRAIKGVDPEIVGTPWGTDAGALIRYGNTPTIVIGPGPGGMAHKANEYVDVEMMQDTIKIFACTILDWCGYDQ